MQRKDLINRYIQLTKRVGNYKPLYVDRVIKVDDQIIYGNSGGQYVLSDDDFIVVPDPLADFKLEIGIEVILKKDTTSLPHGSKIIIEDFLDEEKSKIISRCVAPGGWINKGDVSLNIDLSKYRFKTYIECCLEFGLDWQARNNWLNTKCFEYLGRSLKGLIIELSPYNNSLIMSGGTVWGIYITDAPAPNKKYKLQIISKAEFEEFKKELGTDHQYYKKNMTDIYDAPLESLQLEQNLLKKHVKDQIKWLVERDSVNTKDGKQVYIKFLKLVEDNSKKEESKSQVENTEASEALEAAKIVNVDSFEHLLKLSKDTKRPKRVEEVNYTEDDKIVDPTPGQMAEMIRIKQNEVMWGRRSAEMPGIGKKGGWDFGIKPVPSPMYEMEIDNNGLTQAELDRLDELKLEELKLKIHQENIKSQQDFENMLKGNDEDIEWDHNDHTDSD